MTFALPSILEAILSPELKSPGKSSSARLPRGMKLVQFKKKLRHSRPGENCIAGVCCDRVISLACLYCETEKMQAFFFFRVYVTKWESWSHARRSLRRPCKLGIRIAVTKAMHRIGIIRDTHHLCTRFRIDGMKVMSRGNSGGKQKIKFTNARNRTLFIPLKRKDDLIAMQNVRFEFRRN